MSTTYQVTRANVKWALRELFPHFNDSKFLEIVEEELEKFPMWIPMAASHCFELDLRTEAAEIIRQALKQMRSPGWIAE